MDPELAAVIAAPTRLDLDASRVRLALAVGGTLEDVAAIMEAPAEREPDNTKSFRPS
jgi:hypothetical protein